MVPSFPLRSQYEGAHMCLPCLAHRAQTWLLLPPSESNPHSQAYKRIGHTFFCLRADTLPPILSAQFSTDSYAISVGNCASPTIANNLACFEDLRPLAPTNNASIKGISGAIYIKKLGTFVFDIEDDDGKVHTIRIANSAYAPAMHGCLLSPQHSSQNPK